ncbi:hypothetical protein [Flavobacterium sp. SM2513]|uniref:hypothetical protein n=1 Tax=Flavobacterium sp. SM2513 TaxID=3424766 RepID=UPI003D7FC85A
MNKEQFIEKILNSTNGIQKVEPSDALFDKIQLRIEAEKPVNNYVTWLVAASVVVLVTLNVGILLNSSSSSTSANELSSLVSTTNNQLY